MNEERTMPQRIPATPGLGFPYEAGDRLADSTIRSRSGGREVTITLADGQSGTYYLEPAPGGRGGTWHLRR